LILIYATNLLQTQLYEEARRHFQFRIQPDDEKKQGTFALRCRNAVTKGKRIYLLFELQSDGVQPGEGRVVVCEWHLESRRAA
jgi:hypothetical protein